MSILKHVVFASLCLGIAACESPADEGAQECPAGSGAVFVESGPNGPGCYCPVGFMPDATNSRCVPGDACAPFGRTEAGACVDIDECATGTAGCDASAVCTNLINDGATCACPANAIGDGITCEVCPAGTEPRVGFAACQDINECERGTAGCSPDALCHNELAGGGATCTCNDGFIGDGVTCTYCEDPTWSNDDHTACVPDLNPCAHGRLCSSLADPDGPYPDMQCAGTVGPEQIWFQTNQKTTFPVDCRCPHGGIDGGQFCIAPTGNEGGNHEGLGSGPNAADLVNGEIKGCATNFDEKVVYFGVNWGVERSAMIFAMDPVTADRTLISGEDSNNATGLYSKGTGPAFDTILDMGLGKDGFLYVFIDSVPEFTDLTDKLFGRSIYRVNITTGDRELWWNDREEAFWGANCAGPNAFLDLYNHQFELDENDNFFIAERGGGIIRVANDRSRCDTISQNTVNGGPGTGVDIGMDSGWGYKDGFIYATSFFGGLFKVEVATGNRTRIWGAPGLGEGPGPGMWQFLYIPYFKLWVAGGNEAQTPSNAALFDPDSGDTWQWMYQRPNAETGGGTGGQDTFFGPINTNPTGYLRGPITGVLDSTLIDRPWCLSPIAENRLFVATDRVGIVIVELETGNTMNFSQ